MKRTLIHLVTPFRKLSPREELISIASLIVIILTLWSTSSHGFIASPMEIVTVIPELLEKNDLVDNFLKSLMFCMKSMLYATCIGFFVACLSVIPVFRTFCMFLRKFRFLPSAGLSFLFMKLSVAYGNGIDSMMAYMMIFGITTWMIDGMVGVAASVTDDEVMYAKSLRLSKWKSMREILIYGKAAQMFLVAISVFAISWMLLAAVENIAKANGGIGVVISDANKYFKLEKVYAVQLIILLTGISVDWALRKFRLFLFPYAK